MEELKLIQDDTTEYITYIEALSSGEYSGIPLHNRQMSVEGNIDYALQYISTNSHAIQYWKDVYTWERYGVEKHLWRPIGYESFERTDHNQGLIKLYFLPVFPEIFVTCA